MEQGVRQLTGTDLNTVTSTKQDTLGALGSTGDGRLFRYVGFGYTSTYTSYLPGWLMIAQPAPANSTGLAITAAGTGGQVTANLQAGSQVLVITNSSTAVWQDEFQYLQIMVGGSGATGAYNLKLRGNTSAAASTGYITCYLQDPLPPNMVTLIAGTDTASLRVNPWDWVVPSATEGKAIGVTQCPTATLPTAAKSSSNASTNSYGWVQTQGYASVYATSGTLGYPVGQDTTNLGAVINKASGTTTEEIGTFVTANATTDGGNVYLRVA